MTEWTASPFHEGELAVQERAGSRAMAEKIGAGIHGELPDRFLDFLATRPFLLVAARDRSGRLWASALLGAAGFLRVLDPRTIRIEAGFAADDPLASAFPEVAAVGALAIDFTSRRRVRLNGTARLDGGGLRLALREVFPNCTKHVRPREPVGTGPTATTPPASSRTLRAPTLTPAIAARIAAADTFFVATAHERAGADLSHRGGPAGFVRIVGDRRLAWPEYAGNFMFQTLGNLASDPAAALLFVDFERGAVLQLAGRATVDWSDDRRREFPGAERVVDFEIETIVDRAGGAPLRMRPLPPRDDA